MRHATYPMPSIFTQIPDIKRYNQQFELLPQVNPFVVEQPFIGGVVFVLNQYERKQRYTMYPQKRNVYQYQGLNSWWLNGLMVEVRAAGF